MPPVKPITLTPDDHKRLWLCRNRGVLTRIAQETGVGRAWVSAVLYGKKGEKSADYKVERLLAAAGAPFMSERLEKSA